MTRLLDSIVMWYMQKKLKSLRRKQETPYIFIKGTGNDYPKYLMFTDNKEIRNKMCSIE